MKRSLLLPLFIAAVLLASVSAFAQSPQTVGQPWFGGKGVTESVNQIMARQAVAPTAPANGELREKIEPTERPDPTPNPASPEVATWPTQFAKSPILDARTSFLSPQAIGANFATINANSSPYTPPDCGADVGPTQVLVHVNGYIRVYDKSGTVGPLAATDDVFWASVRTANGESDPHIRYDRLAKRWVVVCIDVSATSNYVLIAVSSDSVITGTGSFTFYRFAHDGVGGGTSDNGGFADYPTLGIDANALYIGVNVFNAAGNAVLGTTGFVVRKSALYSGSLVVTAFRQLTNGSGAGPWTPQGVDNDDPAATEGYFIGVDFVNYGLLVIRRVSNPGGTPTISSDITLTVPSTAAPQLQPHLGATNNNRRLDALDDRLYAAHIRKNKLTGVSSLWTAHNIGVTNAGVASGSPTRNGSRWYQIGTMTGTPTLLQSGTLYDPAASNPRGYWIPSVAMSGQGHMVLGSSYAGLADRAGVSVAGRLSSDASGTIQAPTLAVVSTTNYNAEATDGQRWGDYSQTVVDPNDDMTIWTFQDYCELTNVWGIRAVQLRAPLPAAPTSASPSSLAAGASNASVAITGTSSGGTGFFDPGAGYTNHISASVSGTGVTVNSVAFTSPTSITLNLTVAPGATLGARSITVTNPDGQIATSASGILTITSTCGTITVAPASLSNGAAGSPYSQSITASGGTGPYTYAVTSGAIPAGVTLSSGGLLSGTPTYGGSYSFTVTATDANFCSGAQAYTWTVTGCPQLTLSPASTPNDTLGVAYNQAVTTSGGTGPYTYAIFAGALPAGLTLSSGGVISGTPTSIGTANFTVQSTDANLCTGTRAYSIQVFCPAIALSPSTLPSDTVGKAYSQNVTASGGTPSYTYTISAGALPTGLSLSPGGAITGTLTTVGAYNFTVQAADGIGCTGTRAYSVTVYAVVPPNYISLAGQGTAVVENFDGLASTGTTNTTLPAGWSFLESGSAANTTYAADSGQTTAGNTYSYGSTGASDRAFGMLFSGSLTPLIGAQVKNNTGAMVTSLEVSYVGEQWRLGALSRVDSLQFEMSMDATSIASSPGTWTGYPQLTFPTQTITGSTGAKNGNSAGFRATKTATITGLSIAPGATFYIRWKDFNATGADDGLAVDSFAITANPGGGSPTNPTAVGSSSPSSVVVGNTSLLSATVTPGTIPTSTGITVTVDLSSIGGSASQSFFNDGTNGDVTNGDNIWSYRATVALATPPGAKSFAVSVADAQARNGSASINLTALACPTVTLAPASLPAGVTGTAYSQAVNASGGTGPYAYALQVPDTLPTGLTLSGAGLISGTPTKAAAVNFTVIATDSNGCTGTKAYSITVSCPTITISPSIVRVGAVSYAYAETLSASGGSAPYGFALQVPDTLPAGLVLGAGGIISGTPTLSSSTDFTVIVTDANGCTSTRAYNIEIDPCPAITLAPVSLASPVVGASYSQTITASGARSPYVFTLLSGTLPAGLSLAPSGALTGIPSVAGPATFTIGATDSTGCVDSASYAVTAACPTITLTPASLPGATVGSAYAQAVGSAGGHGAVSYAVTLGTLPAGCTLATSGLLSGLPTAAGTFAFTVTATDSFGCTGARAETLHVTCPTITVSPASLPGATRSSAYSEQLSATGGTGSYAYAVTLGSLPAGITLSASGLVSGTPTTVGNASFTVTATDSFGCTGVRAYALAVGCPPITVLPATLADDSVWHAISVTISATGGVAPYTFTVTSGALPAGLTLATSGALTGTATTPGSAAFTITATGSDDCQGSQAYTWQINPTSQVTVEVPIAGRWNILSSPLAGDPVAATTMYPTAVSAAYAFVPSTGYVPSSTLAHGSGYWLKFGAATSASVSGFPLLADTLAVLPGWNLVGALAQPVPAGSVSAIGTTIISQFYQYANGYTAADSLLPGHGYWVNVSAPGQLVLASGAALPAAAAVRTVPGEPALLSIVIGDAAGNSQELRLDRAASDEAAGFAMLPPVPPKGVFDARFASDRMTEYLDGEKRQEFPIRVSSALAPVNVQWRRSGDDDRHLVLYGTQGSGTPIRAELVGEGSIALRSATSLRIVAEPKKLVPTAYALHQNYPNPFNPSTTFQFDLPVRSSVTLLVMNILGEEVARVYDREDLGPGREEVSFDASRLPSGIYFYRLSARPSDADAPSGATPFVSTRKMILVK